MNRGEWKRIGRSIDRTMFGGGKMSHRTPKLDLLQCKTPLNISIGIFDNSEVCYRRNGIRRVSLATERGQLKVFFSDKLFQGWINQLLTV